MSRVLVTGAAGAIGQHLVRLLAARGDQITGLGHGAAPQGLPLAGWINGEIDAANLAGLAARHGHPDAVIHLAGGSTVAPSLAAPAEDFARTVATSVRLLDWVRRDAPEAAVVLTSSAAVYGNADVVPIQERAPRAPLSPYGSHKMMMELAGENFARNFGLKVASVRLFSVYGPGLRKQLLWELCTRLAAGPAELTLGGTGAETRDWVDIEAAARMLARAVPLASVEAPAFNGCGGVGTSVAAVADAVLQGFGSAARIRFTGETRPGDPQHLVGARNPALAVAMDDPLTGIAATAAAAREILPASA